MARSKKGRQTRERLFTTALALFREHGFEATTMRDIANGAGMALGSAYHYFPSKVAMVTAYYDQTLDADEERADAAIAAHESLPERLSAFLHAKLRALEPDQRMLSDVFKYTADKTSAAGVFNEDNREIRARAVAVFERLCDTGELKGHALELMPTLLWSTHMAVMLYFVHDDSPRQDRTHALIDGGVEALGPFIALAKTPLLTPMLDHIQKTLSDAGLLKS